jgi:hypothetical protein
VATDRKHTEDRWWVRALYGALNGIMDFVDWSPVPLSLVLVLIVASATSAITTPALGITLVLAFGLMGRNVASLAKRHRVTPRYSAAYVVVGTLVCLIVSGLTGHLT